MNKSRSDITKELWKNPEYREKVSKSLSDVWNNPESKFNSVNWKQSGAKGSLKKYKGNSVTDILELSTRTISKILKRLLDENKLGCSNCGWNLTVGDLHHIIPKRLKGSDENSNISYLCPNCHRLAHAGIIKSEDLISIEKQLKDTWKDYYFG
jgi:hypothetical protein